MWGGVVLPFFNLLRAHVYESWSLLPQLHGSLTFSSTFSSTNQLKSLGRAFLHRRLRLPKLHVLVENQELLAAEGRQPAGRSRGERSSVPWGAPGSCKPLPGGFSCCFEQFLGKHRMCPRWKNPLWCGGATWEGVEGMGGGDADGERNWEDLGDFRVFLWSCSSLPCGKGMVIPLRPSQGWGLRPRPRR